MIFKDLYIGKKIKNWKENKVLHKAILIFTIIFICFFAYSKNILADSENPVLITDVESFTTATNHAGQTYSGTDYSYVKLSNNLNVSSITGPNFNVWGDFTFDLNGYTLDLGSNSLTLTLRLYNIKLIDTSVGNTGKIISNNSKGTFILFSTSSWNGTANLTFENLKAENSYNSGTTDDSVIYVNTSFSETIKLNFNIKNSYFKSYSRFMTSHYTSNTLNAIRNSYFNLNIEDFIYQGYITKNVAFMTDLDSITKYSRVMNTSNYKLETTDLDNIVTVQDATTYSLNDLSYKIDIKELGALEVDDVTFAPKAYNYVLSVETKNISIKNTAEVDREITSVVSSEPTKFIITGTSPTTIAAGSTNNTSYTIKPVTNLSVGTHTAYIIVTYADGKTSRSGVSFTVNIELTQKPTISGNGEFIYDGTEKNFSANNYYSSIMSRSGSTSAINAGTYNVVYTLLDPTSYNWGDHSTDPVTLTYKINQLDITPSISLDDWTYGEESNTPSIFGNIGGGIETVEYKASDESDDNYTIVVPTDANDYNVRVTIGDTTNYKGNTATDTFSILKADNDVDVTPNTSLVYNTTNQTLISSYTATAEWNVFFAIGTELNVDNYNSLGNTDYPTAKNAGSYTVYYYVPELANYNEVSGSVTVTISQLDITPVVGITDWTYGDTPNSPSIISGNSGSGDVEYLYKLKDADDITYSIDVPSDADDYTVKAIVEETMNYKGGTDTEDFTINKKTLNVSADMKNKKYGESDPTLTYSVTGEVGTEEAAFDGSIARVAGDNIGEYNITVGTLALKNNGSFKASNYEMNFTPSKLTINKQDISLQANITGWIYGSDTSTPSVTGNTGNGTVTYEYKVKNANDNTYSMEIPTNANTYTLRATVGSTTNYNGSTATKDFTISKKEVSVTSSSIDNITYDATSNIPDNKIHFTLSDADALFTITNKVVSDTNVGNYNAEVTITLNSTNYTFSENSNTKQETIAYTRTAMNSILTSLATSVNPYVVSTSNSGSLVTLIDFITLVPSSQSNSNVTYELVTQGTSASVTSGNLNIPSNYVGTLNVKATYSGYDANLDSALEIGASTTNIYVDVKDRTLVTISGYTYADKKYDGTGVNPTGTLTLTGSLLSDRTSLLNSIEVSYEGTGTTVYNDTVSPTNVGTYKVTYKIPSSNDEYMGSKTYTFAITKAEPIYQIPSNLTAVIGDSSSEISLPTGFIWSDGVFTFSTAGTVKYDLTYTPSDINNYNVIEDIEVNVKIKNIFEITTSVDGSNGIISNGSNNIIEGNSFEITFTPDDGYEINVVNVNGENVTRNVTSNKLTLRNIAENKVVEVSYKISQYDFIEGENQKYIRGTNKDMSFEIDALYRLFTSDSKIYIDGEEITSDDFNSKEGSTIIAIKEDFMNTLSFGAHTFKAEFGGGGYAETTFTVSEVVKANPKTFDGIIYYLCIGLFSTIGLIGITYINRKKMLSAK